MRVIAGELKGRRLKSVPGKSTRPTSDKVKEAVFHMIGPYFNGGNCLDLFAGSGSLGIEAISRGIEYAVFIDKNRKAIQTIYENVNHLNITKQVKISRMDSFRALKALEKNNIRFNIIFLDPPYMEGKYEKLIYEIIKRNLLEKNGIIYCEHEATFNLPPLSIDLQLMKRVNYGGTTGITIYRS